MSLQKFASSNAHRILAKLIDAGIVPPDASGIVAAAKSEDAKLQVVITIASYEPVTISAETLARIDAMKSHPKPLTPQQKKIVAVLAGQPSRKAQWIALKIGKRGADGHLRSTLADMLAAGLLTKGADGYGYQLPPAPPSDSRACAS